MSTNYHKNTIKSMQCRFPPQPSSKLPLLLAASAARTPWTDLIIHLVNLGRSVYSVQPGRSLNMSFPATSSNKATIQESLHFTTIFPFATLLLTNPVLNTPHPREDDSGYDCSGLLGELQQTRSVRQEVQRFIRPSPQLGLVPYTDLGQVGVKGEGLNPNCCGKGGLIWPDPKLN